MKRIGWSRTISDWVDLAAAAFVQSEGDVFCGIGERVRCVCTVNTHSHLGGAGGLILRVKWQLEKKMLI